MKQKLLKFRMRALMLTMLLIGSVSETLAIDKTISQLVTDGELTTDSYDLEFQLDENITISTLGGSNESGYVHKVGNNTYWYLYGNSGDNLTITAKEGFTIESVMIYYVPNTSNPSYFYDGNDQVMTQTKRGVYKNSVTYTIGHPESSTGVPYLRVFRISVEYRELIAVPLNKYGYATFTSSAPVYLTNGFNPSTYTAWELTGVNGNNITFEQITNSYNEALGIKPGTGILLMGDPDGVYNLPKTTNMTDIAGSNSKLVGITEETTVAEGEYFGLVGNAFVPVAGGTVVPAGKALLPASVVGSVKTMNIVFSDETGIREVRTVSGEQAAEIFNLAGQRLQKTQKGVNIVNGKKVLVK